MLRTQSRAKLHYKDQEDPRQPPPFSMQSKLLILHGEAKFYPFTVSCVPESMFYCLEYFHSAILRFELIKPNSDIQTKTVWLTKAPQGFLPKVAKSIRSLFVAVTPFKRLDTKKTKLD